MLQCIEGWMPLWCEDTRSMYVTMYIIIIIIIIIITIIIQNLYSAPIHINTCSKVL